MKKRVIAGLATCAVVGILMGVFLKMMGVESPGVIGAISGLVGVVSVAALNRAVPK